MIATSLGIIGIFVAVIISVTREKRDKGASITYIFKWILVGFVIGALVYVLGNSINA